MNNGKTFSSLDGMVCSYQCSDQFLPGHWQAKRYWKFWDLKKPNLFKNNLNNTNRNNIKYQVQNEKNGRIVELLIPTLNKIISRSSHQRGSLRKGVIRKFTKFTEKHLCQSFFSCCNKATATLLKKRLWYRCFPVDFAKFSRTPF